MRRRVVPVEGELTLCPEEVDVVLELQLEDKVLVDIVLAAGGVHGVAQQRQARQREVVLYKPRLILAIFKNGFHNLKFHAT